MRKLWAVIRRFLRGMRLPKSPAGRRWVLFDDGRVAFLTPTDFAMHREPEETIAVHPLGNDSGITLRFSLHPKALDCQMPDAAERFVEDHAKEKGLLFTRLKDLVYSTETCEADWPDRRVLMHYWQVGVGRVLVVCSATIWGIDRDSETIQKTLAIVPEIIKSLRIT